MRNPIFFLLALVLSSNAWCADKKFPITELSENLISGADAIKRTEDMRLEVIGPGKSVLRTYYAITVLNERGAAYASLEESYDKLHQIESVEGWLYDAFGNEVRRLKNKDIKDESAVSSISLHEDDRVKRHSFAGASFPYTVAYELTIVFNHSYYFRPWLPQEAERISVAESKLTVVSPADYSVRYRNCNYPQAPQAATEQGKKVLRWSVKNLKALERPYASPVWHELTTAVYLAPSAFEVQGYKGVMDSWSELARFQASLNKDRDVLTPAVVQEVARLTNGLATNRQKVEALYHYLQQNTRYISIQLGIGGWQPFEASMVAQKGYGDCKALSNYMYSLLKAAGINSHYALILAGKNRESRYSFADFPMIRFNHAVLCVPLEKDTMWLECTSQTSPAGYMGAFTGNRKALVITADGGALVSTPRYGATDNLQARSITGTLDATGSLALQVRTRYTCEQQEQKQGLLQHVTRDELKKHLNSEMDLSTYNIVDFKFSERPGMKPEIDEALQVEVSRYATVSGKRLFIQPNLLNRSGSPYEADTARTHDFVFDLEYTDVDSLELTIPDGYVPEAVPAAVELKAPYGRYSSSVRIDGNKLLYVRRKEQFATRLKASEAKAVASYMTAVYKADLARVVLVKKE